MIEKKKKSKSYLWCLIGFPIVDVIAVLMFILGTIIDSKIFENSTGQGHPVPVFSLIFFIAAGAIFLLGNLLVLIILIVMIVNSKKNIKKHKI